MKYYTVAENIKAVHGELLWKNLPDALLNKGSNLCSFIHTTISIKYTHTSCKHKSICSQHATTCVKYVHICTNTKMVIFEIVLESLLKTHKELTIVFAFWEEIRMAGE